MMHLQQRLQNNNTRACGPFLLTMADKNIWHIVPENDSKEHKQQSAVKTIVDNDGIMGEFVTCDCGCEPTVVNHPDEVIMIVHESFDGRKQAYFNG